VARKPDTSYFAKKKHIQHT